MPESFDPMLTTFLAERDQPCPQCEYNLRNLHGNRCPECGEELILRINMAEPRQRLLLAGLVGLSFGGGFNGLLIVYVFLTYKGRLPDKFMPVIVGGFFSFALLIFFWLRFWRKLRRRTLITRAVLASLGWLAALIDIVIFSFTIR